MTAQLTPLATATDQDQWTDLYFRHNFDDTGMYPTSGSLSASPDVIPLGNTGVSDPNTLIGDDAWKKDYGNSTNASEPNYIYLRGQNLSSSDTKGKVYLYYSPASLLLWPTDPLDPTKGWAKNPLRTSGGEQSIAVSAAAGARFVTSEGFQWIPTPIYNDHYCLIGRVVTEANPNPLPTVGNLTDFAAYISTHPDMAWRNVVTINPSNPVTTTTVNYSQGTEAGDVYIILRCENVPNGSAVSFSSGTPGPDPLISMGQTVVQNQVGSDGIPRFNLTLLTNIPANWTSNIAYTWYSNGTVPAPNMKIYLDAIMPTSTEHEVLGRFAKPLTSLGIPEEHLGLGPTTGIRLGSQLMQTPAVAMNAPNRVYGSPGQLATATEPAVLFSGVSWGERSSSVFGTRTANLDVAVARQEKSNVQTDVVTLTQVEQAQADDQADVSVDSMLESGPYTGTVLVTLNTVNVPAGCEIWFRNTDGKVTIATSPTKVTNSSKFSVSAIVDALPSDYTAQVRSFLRLNGQQLPSGAELTFSVYSVPEEADREALTAPGAPQPGTLLGAVTLRP